MTESNEELIDMFLYPTLKSMLRDILNKFDYMLRNKDIYLPEAIKDVEHDLELLSRLTRLDEVEKENKELKEKDLYWRKRVTELEENENRFPTLAEFSNLQDDYERTSKENKELKEGLFEKFSECYEVNKWTPESGFDRQLDFYIHESWKREPVVDKLRKQVENLECCGNCLADGCKYKYISSNRYCRDWKSDNMTREDRK